LRVSRGTGTPGHYEEVDLGPSGGRVEVELPGSAVEGRVLDLRGRPIEGAAVRLRRARESDEDGAWERAQRRLANSFIGGSTGVKNRTDGEGRYKIESIPVGIPYEVVVSADGYVEGSSEPFEADEDEEVHAATVRISPAGSIRVLVPGAEMMFQTIYARRTDAEGKTIGRSLGMVRGGAALLRGLAPGEWLVSKERDEEGQSVLVHAGEESELELL